MTLGIVILCMMCIAQADGTVSVYRWWHSDDKDWITLADGEISDDQMRAWGYTDKKFQFYAWNYPLKDRNVAVYRWWHPDDKDWITLADGEISDDQMKAWGYTDKKLQFYASRTVDSVSGNPDHQPVAVYRWWHPGDKDWITLADGEISDDQMKAWGYTNKKLQFYAEML